MATVVIFEEQVAIPMNLRSFAEFCQWARSDEFPNRGRIDYIAGRIEVDMSPEDFFCHGTLKTEILGTLYPKIKAANLGYLVTDRTRITCFEADLSAEPDIVFVSHAAIDAGQVRLVPSTAGEPGRYAEVEGAPDLIVEIVSDSSILKDTQRLPEAYFGAGVREFWLADARREPLRFQIYRPGESGFEAVEPDADGFQASAVFACHYRLAGSRNERAHWRFDLHQR